MTLFDLLLIGLASLYITHVMTTNTGPFRVFVWLRDRMRTLLGGLFDCFFCLIVWVALVMLAIYQTYPPMVWVLAIAGAAILAWTYSGLSDG